MTIVTSEIVKQTTQKNGTINVDVIFTDQTGKTFTRSYNAANVGMIATINSSLESRINDRLKQNDLFNAVFTKPWDYTLIHATLTDLRDYVRELYLESEKEQTVLIALRLEEWIVNGRFTVAQLRQAFNLNTSQFDALRTKWQNFKDAFDVIEGAAGE